MWISCIFAWKRSILSTPCATIFSATYWRQGKSAPKQLEGPYSARSSADGLVNTYRIWTLLSVERAGKQLPSVTGMSEYSFNVQQKLATTTCGNFSRPAINFGRSLGGSAICQAPKACCKSEKFLDIHQLSPRVLRFTLSARLEQCHVIEYLRGAPFCAQSESLTNSSSNHELALLLPSPTPKPFAALHRWLMKSVDVPRFKSFKSSLWNSSGKRVLNPWILKWNS